MGFDRRDKAKRYLPLEGDTLQKIAERETAAGNPITWQELARFNWGTDDEAEVNVFLRDELGARHRNADNNFVLSPDDASQGQLLIPVRFERHGLALKKTYTLRVRRKMAPPQFLECCHLPGVTFAFNSSFIRPDVVGFLKKLEAVAGRHPEAEIMIFGHTDAVGDDLSNKKLSERRAWSVYAFVTNDPEAWEVLYNHPDEDWGLAIIQEILADLGCYEDAPDGDWGPSTRAAMRAFLGLPAGAPVQNDAAFRKQLFAAYMASKHDIDLPSERFMEPGYMGCGEFNPVAQTVDEDEQNRRVTFFFFHPERLPKLPCAFADVGPCERQQVSLEHRYAQGFSCSFYDSLARRCTEHWIRVRRPMTIVGMEGLCFHTNREVLLPDPLLESGDVQTPRVTSLTLAKAVIEHAEAHPAKRILIAGHTDTTAEEAHNRALSERRADNVFRFLTGDRRGWAAHAQEYHEVGDWQHVLGWIAASRSWDCDPGPVDDDCGPLSEEGRRRFRARYNQEFGASLPEEGPISAEDWGAFFDVFDQALSELLGCAPQDLERRRAALRFLPTPWIGCGEAFPIDGVGLDGYQSRENRRVEILFFDERDAPRTATDPPGNDIYGRRRYAPQHLRPLEVRGGHCLWVRIDRGTYVDAFAERFRLSSSDGALQAELIPQRDGILAGDHLDLYFTGLALEETYSLECATPDGSAKRALFTGVPYTDLAGLSPSVTPGEDPEWDPSEIEIDFLGEIR